MNAAFEPTTDGIKNWLNSLPEEQRSDMCMFLLSGECRSAIADVMDIVIVRLTTTMTYSQIAELYGCTVSNVQRRVTRYRSRQLAGRLAQIDAQEASE
jgi:DNA-directed RNA polymerase specialized sigma24 family protein